MSAVGELTVNIVGDMSKLSSAFSKASSEVGKFGSSVTGIGSSMTSKVGSALSTVGTAAVVTGTALGAGLVAGGAKATSMFVDFEKSVSNAASVTGLTGQAFKDAKKNISDVAQELGQKTAFSSSQAADALYNLASAGVDVSAITSDKLIPVLSLASGTQYDLADTTDVVTSTLSQFGLQFESAGRVSDVFAKSAALSQASMDKLKYSMAQVGTIASSAGLSLEDTTAALSKMYDAGMDGSSAGTGLKGVIASLMAPTSNATDVFKNMGLTLADISPASNKFSDIIEKLKEHGLDSTKAFQLFGREGAPAIMALVNQSDGLKTMTDQLKEAGGAAQTMADQQLDTLSGSLDSLSGSIENVWINVGQALAPTIRSVADGLTAAIPGIQNFVVGATESFVGFIGGLGKSISSLSTIGSTILDIFKSIFESVFGSVSSIEGSLSGVINGIMSRIAGIVVEAAPFIENSVIGIIGFFKDLVTALQPTWTNLTSIATNLITLFRELFSGITGAGTTTAATTIASVITTISSVLAQLVGAATSAFIQILPTLRSIFSTIVDTTRNVYTSLSEAVSNISEKLGPTWTNLGLIFDAGSRLVTSAIQPLIPAFNSLFSSLGNSSTIDSISTTIANFFNTVTEAIAGFMMSLAENGGISGAIEGIFDIDLSTASDSIKTAFDTIKSIFDTGKTIITGFISDLSPSWDNLKSSFDSIKTIIEEVAPSFTSFFDTLGGSSGNTAVSVTSLLAGVINTLTGAIAGLLKWLADNPKVVEFGIALAGVAVAASGLVIGLASVIAVLTPIFAAISSGIAFVAGLSLSWASLGTVVSVIGTSLFPTLAAAIGTVGSIALPALATALSVASGVIGVIAYTVIPILVEALGLLISPIGLVIGSIALLYVAWTKNWGDIQGKTGEAIDFITEKWNQFTSELGRLPGVASAALGTLSNVFSQSFNSIKTTASTTLQEVINNVTEKMNSIKSYLSSINLSSIASTIWNTFLAGLTSVILGPYNLITVAITTIRSFLSGTNFSSHGQTIWNSFLTGIRAVLQGPYTAISTAINTIKSFLSGTNLSSLGSAVWNSFLNGVRIVIQGPYTLIMTAINAIRSLLSGTNFSSYGQTIWNTFASGIRSIISSPYELISGAINTIRSYLSGVNLYSSGAAIIGSLKDGIESKIQSVKDSVNDLLSWIDKHMPHSPAKEGPLSRLPNFAGYITSPLKSAITSAKSTAKSAGSSIINSISSGIKKATSSVYNAASSTLKKVSNLFPHSPAKEGPFKTLPNWDAVFLDPLSESINKINTLSSPLSSALSNIRNPVDANISSGLNTISNVTTSNSYTYGGDTLNIKGVTLNSPLDVNSLFDEWERRMANKRRARGI